MNDEKKKVKQAVALEYDPSDEAPRVIASGKGILAEKIIEKAQESFDAKKAEELAKKIKTNEFTLEDFMQQMEQMQNMDMGSMLSMVPGMDVGKLGNVRITLDQNIAGSADVGQFFDPRPALHPILPPGQHVLEVKFDEFLPAPIADVLELGEMQRISFSKYTLCREALGPGVKGTLYEHQGRNQEIRFAGIH